jgi:predicted component of type VI protein secretion system
MAKAAFPVTYSAGSRDLFTRYLLDLVGLGTDGLRDRQEIEDEALLHYTIAGGDAVAFSGGSGADH